MKKALSLPTKTATMAASVRPSVSPSVNLLPVAFTAASAAPCPSPSSSRQSPPTMTDANTLADAVARNDSNTVKALIKADVDLRPANWYETPVLVTAAAKGFLEIVQLLVEAHANVNTGYERLPLHSAAESGHLSVVRYLIQAGAYADAQDSRGYSAVMAAAATGQLAVVTFLVDQQGTIASGLANAAMKLAAQGNHQSVYAYFQAIAFPAAPATPMPMVQSQAPQTMSVMDELIAKSAAELKTELFRDA